MIRLLGWLAWRGATTARAESLLRLAVAMVAVVIALLGSALEPSALARSERTAASMLPLAPPEQRDAGIRVVQTDDYFEGEHIQVRTLATVAPVGHRPEWTVPGEGELVVSPAMADLLRTDDVLAERYPGRVVADVPEAAMLGPRSLVVWRGVAPDAMPDDAGWLGTGSARSTEIASTVPTELRFAVPLLVVGFLVPLLALLALVGTLGAARRERRLAAMRLVGLTDREARGASVLEGFLLAVTSCLLGWAAFHFVVPVVARHAPVEGGVWASDVRLPGSALLAVAVGFPLLVMVANWWGLRALRISPLGVERRSHVRRPSRWMTVPFLAGCAVLAAVALGVAPGPMLRSRLILLSALLLTVGLAGVVPLLTRAGAARLAGRTGSLSVLVATRRVLADPAQATRAAVGLGLLVAVTGPLLVFFPLIADASTEDLRRLGGQVGGRTLLATTAPSEDPVRADAERTGTLAEVSDRGRLGDLLVVDVVPLTTGDPQDPGITVAFVDCAALERRTRIPVQTCARGIATGGPDRLQGTFHAYRETESGPEGVLVREQVGDPVTLDLSLESDRAARTLLDGLSTPAQALLPVDLADGRVPVAGFSRSVLATAGDQGLEPARTDVAAISDGEVLTVGERLAIATRTTVEFRRMTLGAGILVVLVAGLATLITSYEQIRRTVDETRLLRISGAGTSFARRALWIQNLTPSLLAVVPAAAVSVALAHGLLGLVDRDGAHLPVAGIVTTAVASLVATVLATQLLSRTVLHDQARLTEE